MDRDPLHDFELLIRSRYGALLVESAEEDRAEALVESAAWRLQLPVFVWRRATGLRRRGAPNGVYGTQDPRIALGHVIESTTPASTSSTGWGRSWRSRRWRTSCARRPSSSPGAPAPSS